MWKIVIFIFCVAFAPVFAQCNVERAQLTFKHSLYKFATEFINRIATDRENHFVTSPLSTWMMLSAISEGADHETLTEIQYVLRLHHQKCFNSKYYKLAGDTILTMNPVDIKRSGVLMFDKSFKIKQTFVKDVRKSKLADVLISSFEHFEDAANEINSYIKQQIHNAPDEIITEEDLRNKYLILIDVIMSKAIWEYSFPLADTEISSFYNEEKKPNGDVNLMFTQGKFNIATIDQLQAKVLELPYNNNDKYSMLVVLPNAETDVSQVFENFKKISIRTILRTFSTIGKIPALVQVPKFKLSSELTGLKDILVDMGLKSMFEANADLSHISEYSLYVSDFIQIADIEVNEDGISTAMPIAENTEPEIETFTANRPFIFMVIDKTAEIIILAGAYSVPSVLY